MNNLLVPTFLMLAFLRLVEYIALISAEVIKLVIRGRLYQRGGGFCTLEASTEVLEVITTEMLICKCQNFCN